VKISKKARIPKMTPHAATSEAREIVKAVEGIEEELGQFVGALDSHQKEILVDLARLHLSLRGPEGLLDKGNYSRAIPQRNWTNPKRSNERT
jgi:hypothetical protein